MSDPKQQIHDWCRNADEQAFRRFYREQSVKLWKFLVARGCERDLAYDIVAEAFLRFSQNVCRDPRAPVALLYRIAVNLRIDAYRHERASPVTEAFTDVPAESPEAVDYVEHAEIRALLGGLPETEQNLLLLRYWIGLSHKEVAETLDLPEGTVRRRCAELLQTLRERLEK